MYNQIILIGRVGSTPEVSEKDGLKLAKFSVAFNKKKNGEEKTMWFSCAAFGGTAEVAEKYVHKSDMIHITGELDIVTHNEKQYNNIRVSTITLITPKPKQDQRPSIEPVDNSVPW